MKISNLLKLLALSGIVFSVSACKPKARTYTDATYAQFYAISDEEDDDSFVLEGQYLRLKNLAFAAYYGDRIVGQFADLESCYGVIVDTAGLNLNFALQLGYEDEEANLGPYDVFEAEGKLVNERGLAVLKADKVTRTVKAKVNDAGTGLDAGELIYSPTQKTRGAWKYWSGRKAIGVQFDQLPLQLVTVPGEVTNEDVHFKAVFPGERTSLTGNKSLIDVVIPAGLGERTKELINEFFATKQALDCAKITVITDFDSERGGVCARVVDPWLRYNSCKLADYEVTNVFQNVDDTLEYMGKYVDSEPLAAMEADDNAFSFVVDAETYMGKGYEEGEIIGSDTGGVVYTTVNTDDSEETFEAIADSLLDAEAVQVSATEFAKWELVPEKTGIDSDSGDTIATMVFKIQAPEADESEEESEPAQPAFNPNAAMADGSEEESEEEVVDPEDIIAYLQLSDDGDTVGLFYIAQLQTFAEVATAAEAVALLDEKVNEFAKGIGDLYPNWSSGLEAADFGDTEILGFKLDWTPINNYVANEIYVVDLYVEVADSDAFMALYGDLYDALEAKYYFYSTFRAFQGMTGGMYSGSHQTFLQVYADNAEMTVLDIVIIATDPYYVAVNTGYNYFNATSFDEAISLLKSEGLMTNYQYYADKNGIRTGFNTGLAAAMLGEGTFDSFQVSFVMNNAGAGVITWYLYVDSETDISATVIAWLTANGYLAGYENFSGVAGYFKAAAYEFVAVSYTAGSETEPGYLTLRVDWNINANYQPSIPAASSEAA